MLVHNHVINVHAPVACRVAPWAEAVGAAARWPGRGHVLYVSYVVSYVRCTVYRIRIISSLCRISPRRSSGLHRTACHVRVAYIVSHLWFQTSNKRMHACLTMCLTSLKVETSRRVSRDTLPSRETRPRRQFGSPVTLRDVQPFICRDAPRAPRRREMSMPRVRDRRRARTGTRTALLVQ